MKNFIKNVFGSKVANNNVVMNNDDMSICLIQVGKATDTTTAVTRILRYIGVGTVQVLAINPNATKIEELMGFKPQAEPEYIGTDANGNKTARISFIVKTVAEDCNGIETTAFLTFNLTAAMIKGSNSGKIQVIDNYGSSPAWGDEAIVKAGKAIVYSDGRNPLIGKYHAVCRGEVGLVNFLRAYLGVPSATNFVNNTMVPKTGEDLKNAELALENIKDYFKGNFKEIEEAIALMPNNKVKVLFGVRTNDDGKQYQDINSEVFMSARSNSTKMMERTINDAKSAGRYANTEYNFNPIHEYAPQPTNFAVETESTDNSSELPFGTESESTPW